MTLYTDEERILDPKKAMSEYRCRLELLHALGVWVQELAPHSDSILGSGARLLPPLPAKDSKNSRAYVGLGPIIPHGKQRDSTQNWPKASGVVGDIFCLP